MPPKLFVYLSKKLSVPNCKEILCVSWNYNKGYIAAGGSDGQLRVFRLPPESEKNPKSPFHSNQSLEGHGATTRVNVVCWNEVYQKLTSSDDSGLIIVWMSHNDSWYEEMINNRNKSSVVQLQWSHDGTKIAIAYEDGQVIVGSVDGNRLWSKEIGSHLAAVTWSTDSSLLLFGLTDGEVHAYDLGGNFVLKVPMICIDSVELEAALSKDLKKDVIVSMEWFVPAFPCRDSETRTIVDGAGGPGTLLPRVINSDTFASETYVFRGRVPEDRPRFLVAYQHGIIQLMRNESDTSPVICRLPSTVIILCRWAPDGTVFAVGGYQNDLPEDERNVMHIISAYGVKLQTMKLPPKNFTGFSWQGNGLRIAIVIDNNLYLAYIKPGYKWTYCNQTVVYSYERVDAYEDVMVFYETKMDEVYTRQIRELCAVTAFEDYCVIVSRVDEVGGAYIMQLCNSIGTPVDSKSLNITPLYVAMNATVVIAASQDSFVVWHYTVPRKTALDAYKQPPKQQNDTVHHIDQLKDPKLSDLRKANKPVDYIKSICAGTNFFLISRESGALHRYGLPDAQLQYRYQLGYAAEMMALNCNNQRLAVITTHNTFRFFDIRENSASVVSNFERRDVWDMKWDTEKEDTIAIMEKSRMIVIQGIEPEEPVPNNGYICCFKDLTVRTVQIHDMVKDPENPDKSFVTDIEVKTLRNAKELLEGMKISEANAFIEKNSHPKLWSLLAKVALNRLDLKTAEHAFVKLKDYAGIRLLKRLEQIQSDPLRKAEVCIFLGDLDAAERIYFENDRRDLAIDMRKKMHDWFRILQILQTSSGAGDDLLMQQAWKHVGDYFMERQKWQTAAKHYEHGQNYSELATCYLMMDDYARLDTLSQHLPDGHEVLKKLGEMFANAGLCEQALDCYIRCELVTEALDVCIRLNQWDKAVELSKKYHLQDVQGLLSKYAEHLTGSNEKTLAAVQLYRKAAKFLQAARIVFEIAKDERIKQAPPLRLKKLYVIGALLVEQYHEQNKAQIAKNKGNNNVSNATIALQGILSEDNTLSMEESKMIDTAWRGAEAFHFLMLAHKQLYQGQYDLAMKTCLTVVEYEDLLDPMEIFSLLALASCVARQFSVCSKAFMKVESMPTLTEDEKELYSKLSLQIFLRYPPKDTRLGKVECTNCDAMIPDYSLVCPNPSCDTRFPVCIASGRPLYDYQFWLCPSCKHRAYEQEIQSYKFCPLCHYEI